MGIKRAWIASVLVCACGPGAKDAGPPQVEAPKPLCVEPASPGGTEISLISEDEPPYDDVEAVEGALDEGWNVSAALNEGATTYAMVSLGGCADTGECDTKLVAITDGKLAHEAELPLGGVTPMAGDDPAFPEWIWMHDGDVWVSYTVSSEPEPAVGGTRYSIVSRFSTDLALRWSAVTFASPDADVNEACESTLTSVDADCDGDLDLVQHERCNPRECELSQDDLDGGMTMPDYCSGDVPISHTVFVQGADGTFLERS